MKNAVGEASKRTVMLFGWIALLIIGLWVASPSARTWYIVPDGTGDAPTIQAGVDSAVAGDVVLVAAGTYQIVSMIAMKGGITVTSESGPMQTKVVPDPSTNPMTSFYFNGITVPTEVSGFWIEGFVETADGWYELGNGMMIFGCTGLTVTHNVITGNAIGIQEDWNSGSSFNNNTVIGNGRVLMRGSLDCRFNIIWDRVSEGGCVGGFFNNVLDLSDACNPYASLSADPQFCGPSAGNYYLQSDSPCAPGNSPVSENGLIGALPVGCATVKAETKTWGAIKDLYRE